VNEYSMYADEIVNRVNITQATQFYGLRYNQHGYAVCPFHAEKTASLKIQGNYAHCFGCGWNHNIIGFVMDTFKLDFKSALIKINSDFGLGLPIDRRPTLREQRDAQHRYDEMQALRAREEAEKQAYSDLYNALWDRYALYDKNRRLYAPQNIDEEFNPLYVEAVSKISYIEYLIDVLL